jgi:hypothetical protein
MPPTAEKRKKRRSERGNWLIVTYLDGHIYQCKWVRTWAGVNMSRREYEKSLAFYKQWGRKGRVLVLDIERMVDFAVTEGANEIHELERLIGIDGGD